MGMLTRISLVFALFATGTAVWGSDEGAARSGWYVGGGLGVAWSSDLKQEGWNQDTFCYPDNACFDEISVSMIPGYRWRYDIALDSGAAFELSLGHFLGPARVELALAQQTNDTRQVFTGISYRDGTAIRPRVYGTVVSNASGMIDQARVRTLTLDAYYDFLHLWGAVSPYVGVGLGYSWVEMAGVRFSTDYRDLSSGAAQVYNPPPAFYNSLQDADLNDSGFAWRLHVGADYAISRRTSLGMRVTWSASEDIEVTGTYETHPMHEVDPAFANTNEFSGARSWSLLFTLKRGLGE